MNAYSVLMSVYHRDRAGWLRLAMDSMFAQTKPPDDFVLVCDGPLPEDLEKVIRDMEGKHPDILQVIRLEENRGLGSALMAGMPFCRCEIVARMDSDDISRPDRCERQLQVMEEHPDIDIVSGTIEEFQEFRGEKTRMTGYRILPERPEDILRYARLRCPFNHPCVMYRKAAVLADGGYSGEDYPEDYYLWVRMLLHGSRGWNVQEPLLWMRAGADMYRRRAGGEYLRKHLRLFRYMRREGFITPLQFLYCSSVRTLSAVLPNALRARLYKNLLHSRK